MKKFLVLVAAILLVPGLAFAGDVIKEGPGAQHHIINIDGGGGTVGGDVNIKNKNKVNVDVDVKNRIRNDVDVDIHGEFDPEFNNYNFGINKQGQGQEQDQSQHQGQGQYQGQNNRQRIDPRQTTVITFEDKRELLNTPDLMPAPDAVTPYKAQGWINEPLFLPASLTMEQADNCRKAGIDDEFYGKGTDEASALIQLLYPHKGDKIVGENLEHYIGTATAEEDGDTPFLAVLCEAAYRAMEEGATSAVVAFQIRPLSETSSLGLGASGAGSILPTTSGSPYGLSATVGPSLGVSSSWVEGELIVHLTSFNN